MFYYIVMYTELVNTEPLFLEVLQGWVSLLTIFSATDQYTTLFYVCFCLKDTYLIHIVDSR